MSLETLKKSNNPLAFVIVTVLSFVVFLVVYTVVSAKTAITFLIWMCSFAFVASLYNLLFNSKG